MAVVNVHKPFKARRAMSVFLTIANPSAFLDQTPKWSKVEQNRRCIFCHGFDSKSIQNPQAIVKTN
jgi:hypothetical protein